MRSVNLLYDPFTQEICWDLLPEWRGLPVMIDELSGGNTNRLYRVQSAKGDYSIRIHGEKTELYINRDDEVQAIARMAELGIGPALIKYLPERGVTIGEFIGHGVTLSNADFLNPSLYTRVMAPIRRMHQSGVRLNRVFNPQTQVHAMADLLQQRLGVQYQEFEVERSLERLNRLAERIAVPEDRYVACHNDLVAENFILLDEKWASQHRTPVYIIDWEYAGMAPACYDLGDLFQEVRVPRQNEKQMLEAYCGTDAFDQTLYMVDLYKPFADAYWFLWSMVQRQISAKSFDFYNYGRVKYENMLRTFEFLKSEYGEKI